MIECPVCKNPNDEFAIKCASCGSYIQDRVPNLDFFAMLWMLVESPRQAFKKIILAEHKNFVLLISLFAGVAVSFALAWIEKSGNNYDNLLPLMLVGTVLGVAISLPFFFALAGSIHFLAKLLWGKGTWNESYAVVGWALAPVLYTVVFILPVELATVGLYFFSSQPDGFVVKPVVYSILIGIDGLCVSWSLVLGAVGISMAHRFSFVAGLVVTGTAALAVIYLSVIIYSSFHI